MRRLGTASRAAAGLGAAQVAGQAIGVAMTLVLARRLGLIAFGEYALAGAVLYVANVGSTFGTDMVLVREIAATRRVRRAAAAVVVQLGLSLLVIGVIAAVAPLLSGGHGDVALALRVISLSLLPATFFAVGTSVLRGVGMMRAYGAASIASALVPCVAVVTLVPAGAGVVRVVVVLAGAQAVVGVAVWTLCTARVRGVAFLPRASWSEVRAMLRDSAPVGVLGGIGMAYQRLPVLVLAVVAGPAATGWFSAASRTVEASKTANLGLFSAVYPSLAAAHAGARRDVAAARDLRWSWRLNVGLSTAVTVVLLLAGSLLLERLFGGAFHPAGNALRVLALAIVPSTVATYRSLELLAAHREAATLRVLGASLLVLGVAMAMFVPMLGWVGACWAVLLGETVQAGLMLATQTRAQPRTPRVARATRVPA